jgi:hypothetical protein
LLVGLGIPKLYWIKEERVDTLVSFLTLEEMVSVFLHLGKNWMHDIDYRFIK